MKFRAKVTLEYKSPNYVLDPHNPWTMTFHNIRNGQGEKPIELVHPGTNGKEYVWINPGNWITHSVASGSKFALREDGVDPRDTMATMTFVLTDPTDEELQAEPQVLETDFLKATVLTAAKQQAARINAAIARAVEL